MAGRMFQRAVGYILTFLIGMCLVSAWLVTSTLLDWYSGFCSICRKATAVRTGLPQVLLQNARFVVHFVQKTNGPQTVEEENTFFSKQNF